MGVDLKDVLKYVNVRGLLADLLLKEVLTPALKKLVEKSDNKIDDAAVAMLLPLVEQGLVDIIDSLLKKLDEK